MSKRTIQIKANAVPFILGENYAPISSQNLTQQKFGRGSAEPIRPVGMANVLPTPYGVTSFFGKDYASKLDIPFDVEYIFTYNDELGNNVIVCLTQAGEAQFSVDGVNWSFAGSSYWQLQTLSDITLTSSGVPLETGKTPFSNRLILESEAGLPLYLDGEYGQLDLMPAVDPATVITNGLDNLYPLPFSSPQLDRLNSVVVVEEVPAGNSPAPTIVAQVTTGFPVDFSSVPVVATRFESIGGKLAGGREYSLGSIIPGSGTSGVNFDVTVDYSGIENLAAWAGKLFTGNYRIYPVGWELPVIYNNALYHNSGISTGRSSQYTPTASMDALLKLLVTYATEFATGNYVIKNLVSNGLNNISGLRIEPGLVGYPEQEVAPMLMPNVFWFEGTNLYPPAVPTGNPNNTVPKGSLIATIPDPQFGIDITIPALEPGKTMFLLEFTYLNVSNIWGDYLAFYMNGVNLPCVSDYAKVYYSIDETNQVAYNNGSPGDEVEHLLLPIAVINGIDPTAGTNTIRIENESGSRGSNYVNGVYVYPDPGNLTIRMYNLPGSDSISDGNPQVVNYSLAVNQSYALPNYTPEEEVFLTNPTTLSKGRVTGVDPVTSAILSLEQIIQTPQEYVDNLVYLGRKTYAAKSTIATYQQGFPIESESSPSTSLLASPTVPLTSPSSSLTNETNFLSYGSESDIFSVGNSVNNLSSFFSTIYNKLPTGTNLVNPWTWTVLKNKLYCFKQGLNFILFYDDINTKWVELTPSFLNISQIRGIFQAKGRLGAWDATNTLYISSSLDPMDFTPSLATRADSLQVDAIRGNIVNILPFYDGFIIYSTSSIIKATFVGGTYTFKYDSMSNSLGVLNTKSVIEGGQGVHFAYTNGGLKLVSNSGLQGISTEVDSYIQQSKFPVRLDYIEERYLVISLTPEASGLFTFGSVESMGIDIPAVYGQLIDSVNIKEYSTVWVNDPPINSIPVGTKPTSTDTHMPTIAAKIPLTGPNIITTGISTGENVVTIPILSAWAKSTTAGGSVGIAQQISASPGTASSWQNMMRGAAFPDVSAALHTLNHDLFPLRHDIIHAVGSVIQVREKFVLHLAGMMALEAYETYRKLVTVVASDFNKRSKYPHGVLQLIANQHWLPSSYNTLPGITNAISARQVTVTINASGVFITQSMSTPFTMGFALAPGFYATNGFHQGVSAINGALTYGVPDLNNVDFGDTFDESISAYPTLFSNLKASGFSKNKFTPSRLRPASGYAPLQNRVELPDNGTVSPGGSVSASVVNALSPGANVGGTVPFSTRGDVLMDNSTMFPRVPTNPVFSPSGVGAAPFEQLVSSVYYNTGVVTPISYTVKYRDLLHRPASLISYDAAGNPLAASVGAFDAMGLNLTANNLAMQEANVIGNVPGQVNGSTITPGMA